jgi:hypothetical protein
VREAEVELLLLQDAEVVLFHRSLQ